jgi:hypothetical protein
LIFKVEDYKFESIEGEKGFGNLIEFLRKQKRGQDLDLDLALVACYFIQKDHESQEWFSKIIGEVESRLIDQIKILQDRVRELENGKT